VAGRHSTSSDQKFPLPTLTSDGKIQIPALLDFNAGIWWFGMCVFDQLFAVNSQELFVWCQQLVGE